MRSRHRLSAWSMLGALIGFIVLTALIAPRASAAGITRAAETDTPGQFEFRAHGFRAGEEVGIRLLGPSGQNVRFGSDDASKNGDVRFTLRIPRHFEPGPWTLRLSGKDSDKEAEATFSVPRRLPDANLAVSQATAAPGATLTFTSGDFQPGEAVSYWLASPAGESIPGGALFVGESGQFSVVYTIPSTAPPGVWQMTAYGQTSDRQGNAVFAVAP